MLSDAQRRVLQRMADGDEVWTVTGRNASCFWHHSLRDRSPGFPTMTALWRLGFVEDYNNARSGGQYRITASGREALRSLQPEAKSGK